MRVPFRSLRTRLLVPLAACSLLAAVAVGGVSYVLGDRVVQRSMSSRFVAIRSTLSGATFPLTPSVLKTLAELTETELASYGPQGRLIDSSHPDVPRSLPLERSRSWAADFDPGIVPGYLARRFDRRHIGGDPRTVAHVLVLFDRQDLQHSRISAASLPLATGLSSTLLLSIVAWLLTQRIIHRIALLERGVERIAAGDFHSWDRAPQPREADTEAPLDELGRLGVAMRKMGRELGVLWEAVHRQERQKLIHQMAAGLAHQLRNSLTGARMAVELHARRWPSPSGNALEIAVRELERTEDYVQRILQIAAKPRDSSLPGTVGEAIAEVRASLQVVADHHHVRLDWQIAPAVEPERIADLAGLTAALENLVINGIQAGGDAVEVLAERSGSRVRFKVADNGPGPSGGAEVDLFEPFVTSKPEGLGLGLALVRRAAEDLGGDVHWFRRDSNTIFVLSVTPLP